MDLHTAIKSLDSKNGFNNKKICFLGLQIVSGKNSKRLKPNSFRFNAILASMLSGWFLLQILLVVRFNAILTSTL